MGREQSGAGKLLYLLLALTLTFPLGCSFFKKEERPEPVEKQEVIIKEPPVPEKIEPPVLIIEEKKETAEERKKKEIETRLAQAKELMTRGDYDAALRESQSVVGLTEKTPPGDEALFTMALVYTHPKNQKKEFKKAIALFQRLLKEYPRSSLTEEARIWISVLQTIEKSKQVDIEIEEMKREISR